MVDTTGLTIKVVNKHHKTPGEYIGRGSPLGNPYVVDPNATDPREEAIAKYRLWLIEQIMNQNSTIIAELERLAEILLAEKTLNIQCFCAPKACHGDVIKEVLIKAIAATPEK